MDSERLIKELKKELGKSDLTHLPYNRGFNIYRDTVAELELGSSLYALYVGKNVVPEQNSEFGKFSKFRNVDIYLSDNSQPHTHVDTYGNPLLKDVYQGSNLYIGEGDIFDILVEDDKRASEYYVKEKAAYKVRLEKLAKEYFENK